MAERDVRINSYRPTGRKVAVTERGQDDPADLAVEILSPDDRLSDVRAKVEQYLARGVALVVVIDPDAETAATFRRSAPPATLHGVELLDLDDVVPGFSCRVEEIFS